MATKFSDFSVTTPSFSSGTQTLVGFNSGGSNIKFTMAALANALPYTAGTGLSLSTFQYSLDVAGSGTLGGIAIGYVQTAKNYPVVLDASNQAYVNVPWTDNDTTYTIAVQSATTNILLSPSSGTSSGVAILGGTGINVIRSSSTALQVNSTITQGFTLINVSAPLSTTSTTPTSTTISMTQADASTNGWLSSTDWNTFNSKGNGTVTSVDISSPGGTITATGGPITSSGTLNVDLPNVITASTITYPSSVTVDAQGRVTAIAAGQRLRDTGWSPFEIYGGEQTILADFGVMIQAVASSTFECDSAKIFVPAVPVPSGGPVARIDIYSGTLRSPAAANLIGGGVSGTLNAGINQITMAAPEPGGPIPINAGQDYVILIRCSGNVGLLGKQVPVSDDNLALAATLPISVVTDPAAILNDEITAGTYASENEGNNYRICCHLYEA